MSKKIVNISFEQSEDDIKNKEVTCHVDYIETPMIQLNEIREGNLVYEFGKVHTISFKDDDHWHLENFQPIPLTPEILAEILEKCGWEKVTYYSDSTSYKWGGYFWNFNGWFEIGLKEGNKILTMNCKYLHQLQNLYFALTQTELNIQL